MVSTDRFRHVEAIGYGMTSIARGCAVRVTGAGRRAPGVAQRRAWRARDLFFAMMNRREGGGGGGISGGSLAWEK